MIVRRRNGNMPTKLLRSFVAISEHGSFSKAAAGLNLTQPAISRQIKQLQQLVGGDLFNKKGLSVGLTELGSRVKAHAQRVLTLNDQMIGIGGRDAELETIH